MAPDDEYIERLADTNIVMARVDRGESDLLIVLPPEGTPGVCEDYDSDCWRIVEDWPREMWEWRWALCWSGDRSAGQCPFVD